MRAREGEGGTWVITRAVFNIYIARCIITSAR